MHKILAIIPARGGSKGIPNKNIVELCGKPLIHYTIRESIQVERFDRIFVSTDSQEIKKISEDHGLEVPFLRPNALASDFSLSIDTVFHVLAELKRNLNEHYEYVCLLQPTSPLRTKIDIENCLDLAISSQNDSVVSVTLLDEPHPYKMKIIQNGHLFPFIPGSESSVPRQQLPEVYILNGAIYIAKVSILEKYKSFFSESTIPYIMPQNVSVNINSYLDLELCRILMCEKFEKNSL